MRLERILTGFALFVCISFTSFGLCHAHSYTAGRGICTCKFCRVGSTKRGKRYTKKVFGFLHAYPLLNSFYFQRPMEEEEALALAQGHQMQIKEERGIKMHRGRRGGGSSEGSRERVEEGVGTLGYELILYPDSDDGQSFLPRKRGRGRPPKSRSDLNHSLLMSSMGSDPGDDDYQFDHPLFEGQLDHHYHQLDQLEQLEQLQEQLNQLEQLDQLEQLEMAELEQERLRQEQLGLGPDPTLSLGLHSHGQMPQTPLKRGRGRPPKNPQQQQYKRQKYQKHEAHRKSHQKPRQGRRKSLNALNESSDINEGTLAGEEDKRGGGLE